MGNDRVNLKYLSKRNPTPNVNSDSEMEEFIRNKYEKQIYSNPLNPIQGFAQSSPAQSQYAKQITVLASMGFVNQTSCLDALRQTDGDIERAVDIIVANTPASPKRGSPPALSSRIITPAHQAQLKMLGFKNEDINERAFSAADGNIELTVTVLYDWQAAEAKLSQQTAKYLQSKKKYLETSEAQSFSQQQKSQPVISQHDPFQQPSSQLQSKPQPERQLSAADELFSAFATPSQQSPQQFSNTQNPQLSNQQGQQFANLKIQDYNGNDNFGSRQPQFYQQSQGFQQSQPPAAPKKQQSAAEELFGAFAPSVIPSQSNQPFSGQQTFNQTAQANASTFGNQQNNYFADPQSFAPTNDPFSSNTIQQPNYQKPDAQQSNPFGSQPQQFQNQGNPFGQAQEQPQAAHVEKKQVPKDSILSMYRAEPPRQQSFPQQQGYPIQSGFQQPIYQQQGMNFGYQQQGTNPGFQQQGINPGFQQQGMMSMQHTGMNQHNPFAVPIQPQYTGYNVSLF